MLFRLIKRTSIGNDAIVFLDYNGTSIGRYDLVFTLVRPQMKDSPNMHLFHTLVSLQVLYLGFDKFSQVKGWVIYMRVTYHIEA
jgi:hypothetical protein